MPRPRSFRPRRAAAPGAKETPIHRAILHAVRLALPHAAINHSPNEIANEIARRKAVELGMRAGWPDIEIVEAGRFYAIEVKTARGVQSAEQRACQAAIEAAGGRYGVARSVNDALALLDAWGLTTRARVGA